MSPSRAGLWAVALAALAVAGCESGPDGPSPIGPLPPTPSGAARPLDRLAPGELAPGLVQVFGFVAPRELQLERRFPDAAHLAGTVRAEAVANYVRQRVETERVEIGAARTVFPAARIKGGPPDRIFRIEVVQDGPTTRLVLRDITPPPTTEGLTEEERWRRAGIGPDGKPLIKQ